MKKKMFRQGDVLIERIAVLPKNVKKIDGAILAQGEVTNHAHEIEDPTAVKLFEPENDSALSTTKFMHLMKKSGLIHQEHARIPLSRGNYKVTRQREYTPESILRVAD